MPQQLKIPFKSLEFPDRDTLAPMEIAKKLSISLPQFYVLLEDRCFPAIDVSKKGAQRKTWRMPIEGFTNFIVGRMQPGPRRDELLRQLPRHELESLMQSVAKILNT